jgi:two-component system NtrC family sensor kinase
MKSGRPVLVVDDEPGLRALLVRSTPGQGTTFTISLPAQGEPDAAATVAPRLRLLFIDDDLALLRALRRTLGGVRKVLEAQGGPDAIRLLREERPFDLVVCDLRMPEMNGLEVFRAVKAAAPEQAGRFVFMTGGSPDRALLPELESTGCPLLAKPFGFEALRPFLTPKCEERRQG